jgi:cell division protein FtsW (lipid II flippase)
MNTVKKILLAIMINLLGCILLLGPLIGVVWYIKQKNWILVGLLLIALIIFRQILFFIENKVGIRSYQNPESKYKGSGVTIIAPWLKSKDEKK